MKTLILTLLIPFIFPAAVLPIYFKHIGMNDGLSQVSVMSIYQDQLGRMWFGTREGVSVYDGERMMVFKAARNSEAVNETDVLPGNECESITGNSRGDIFFNCDNALVRYDIRRQQFKTVRSSKLRALSSSNGDVWCVFKDSVFVYDADRDELKFVQTVNTPRVNRLLVVDRDLWIGTKRGLFLQKPGKEAQCIIESVDINSIMRSSTGEFWVGSRMQGLYRIDAQGGITHYSENGKDPALRIASDQVREFAEDSDGNIWFGTFKGLQKYDPLRNSFTVYRQNNLPGDISHISVFALHIDRQGTLWLGTYYGGVNYSNPASDVFEHYISSPGRDECLSHPFVGRMAEDRDGKIWICTEGGGLNCLDRKTNTFKVYANNMPGERSALRHNNLKSISYDSIRHRLYIGTHTGGLYSYDLANNHFHSYLKDFKKGDLKPDEIIYQTGIYDRKLIVSAKNGLYAMNLDDGKFTFITDTVLNFSISPKGYLWTSFNDVIRKININNPADECRISLFDYNINLAATTVMEINGQVYFGTLGAGFYLYDEEADALTPYTTANGRVFGNYCYDMAATAAGNIIITGDRGLTVFSPRGEASRFVKLGTSLPITSITDGCGILVASDRKIYIGGTDGLVSFREEDLDRTDREHRLYFSDVFVQDKKVYPGDSHRILEQALPYVDEIRLAHNQNNLRINFATDNYINLKHSNSYEYMLAPLNDEWLSTSTSTTQLHYNNLAPGRYTLTVREKNIQPQKNAPREIALTVVVSPPWYSSWWAICIYSLASVAVACFFFNSYNVRRSLKQSLKKERDEKDRNDQINEAKLHFFTNISHEFRTPLTLIISQIDLIIESRHALPAPSYGKILKIRKNASRMMDLVTELLDFRKLESGLTKLNIAERDIVAYLQEIFLTFSDMADRRSIAAAFRSEQKSIPVWFDSAQMQKVFFNLLSNAYKFTDDGGNIDLCISEDEKNVTVKLIDSGYGLSGEDMKHIFEHFYQASNGNSGKRSHSTGIGLPLSKKIVELHHGDIRVCSYPRYGTIFTVELPKGREAFENDREVVFVENNDGLFAQQICIAPETEEYGAVPEPPLVAEDGSKRKILIVEDNVELSDILKSLFSPYYTVLTAGNGKEGLEIAVSARPALIISDVMMPVMDGFELCRRLKSNIDACHIPIVILTAFNSAELNIEGLRQGADDYIAKPFNSKILLARCNNLIRSRQMMQSLTAPVPDSGAALVSTSEKDRELLSNAIQCIDRELSNIGFDVNMLAKELGVGRSALFSKFKASTGMTPNDFIQNRRMDKAVLMLRNNPEKQISEISDELGFCSQVYFSRCFKDRFGVSPSIFRKHQRR